MLWKSIQHIYKTPEILRSMIFSTVSCLQSDNGVSASNSVGLLALRRISEMKESKSGNFEYARTETNNCIYVPEWYFVRVIFRNAAGGYPSTQSPGKLRDKAGRVYNR